VKALAKGHDAIREIIALIEKVGAQMNIQKWEVTPKEIDADLKAEIAAACKGKLLEALQVKGKHESDRAVKAVRDEVCAAYEEDEDKMAQAKELFQSCKEEIFREFLLKQRKRTDGRTFDEIRPIWTEVGYLPKTHGSAIFTRGETQALVSLTMGTSSDSQVVDTMLGEWRDRFMLHYNFPAFSVGEVRPNRGPGRREIGHGKLAERALEPVVPSADEFPYTLRLVSEILESNGSSSMASVCGGTMAMLDAGVPIKKPVAGVAMGLVMDEETGEYAVLSDIQGAEDHYGDMDFKVTGTDEGVTALQMDIKVKGLTMEIMTEALEQARKGRLHILDEMAKTINSPREEYRDHVPQIVTIMLPTEKIRDVIGQGGKTIKSIIEKTGVKIDIEDDGKCVIFSPVAAGLREARKMIDELIAVPEAGKSYLGKVKRIVDFGAFVEILPGTEGLLHISEVANYRVRSVSDELKEGEEVMVKCLNVESNGRIKLSRRALLEG
jgi:polyribonucleotide nucleotidyltransferase